MGFLSQSPVRPLSSYITFDFLPMAGNDAFKISFQITRIENSLDEPNQFLFLTLKVSFLFGKFSYLFQLFEFLFEKNHFKSQIASQSERSNRVLLHTECGRDGLFEFEKNSIQSGRLH